MENASKALIIAGAILLSILLISLGIMIFSQAQDTVSSSGMSQAEVQSFNSKFTKYEGNSIRGSQVKSLIQEVRASNSTDIADGNGRCIKLIYKESGTEKKVDTVDAKGIVTTAVVSTSDIQASAKYKVTMPTTNGAGYISEIVIDKQ